jgi:DNA-binding transcriptional LysR family regulator
VARDELGELLAFVAVAEEGSFTRAAIRLRVTTSAVSHAIRALEERLGVRLLARTTHSVGLTEAGEQALAQLRPALGELTAALDRLRGVRGRPAGRVRLVMPRAAFRMVLGPRLAQFARDYPDVVLDVTTDDSSMDLVAAGFDAGIQHGQYIARDMIAVRVTPDQRLAIVAAPGYFESRPKPIEPGDLRGHRCINRRFGSSGVWRWEFEREGRAVTVAVDGPVVLDDAELVLSAALDGVGIACLYEQRVAPLLAEGRLVRVLDDWCPPFPGWFLYYPGRRQQPAALAALVDRLRWREGGGRHCADVASTRTARLSSR